MNFGVSPTRLLPPDLRACVAGSRGRMWGPALVCKYSWKLDLLRQLQRAIAQLQRAVVRLELCTAPSHLRRTMQLHPFLSTNLSSRRKGYTTIICTGVSVMFKQYSSRRKMLMMLSLSSPSSRSFPPTFFQS